MVRERANFLGMTLAVAMLIVAASWSIAGAAAVTINGIDPAAVTNGTYTGVLTTPGLQVQSTGEITMSVASGQFPGYVYGTVSGVSGARIYLEPSPVGATASAGSAKFAMSDVDTGAYSFDNLPEGDYLIQPAKSGYAFDPVGPVQIHVGASGPASVIQQNFAASTAACSPTIAIYGSVSGVPSATLSLTGPVSKTVPVSGSYMFGGLTAGAYTVTPQAAGYTFSPSSRTATIAGDTQWDFVATGQTYTVTGTISGLGGAAVTVSCGGGSPSSTTTNANGYYICTGYSYNSSYTVTPSSASFNFNPSSKSGTVVANVNNVDFSATQVAPLTFVINGSISGLPTGTTVTVSLSGTASKTLSAGNGAFTFTDLSNGSYTVTPSALAGYTVSPSSQPATVNGIDVTISGFTYSPQTPGGLTITADVVYNGASWQGTIGPGATQYFTCTIPAGATSSILATPELSQNADLDTFIIQASTLTEADASKYYRDFAKLYDYYGWLGYAFVVPKSGYPVSLETALTAPPAWARFGLDMSGESIILKQSRGVSGNTTTTLPGKYYIVVKNKSATSCVYRVNWSSY